MWSLEPHSFWEALQQYVTERRPPLGGHMQHGSPLTLDEQKLVVGFVNLRGCRSSWQEARSAASKRGDRRGERSVPPFALIDANHPPVTLEVCQLQRDDLTAPQTSGGGRHQEGAVFGVLGTEEEAWTCLRAQHVWQRRPSRARWEVELEGLSAMRTGGEALLLCSHLMARTPR